jgi:hypothetical protein
MYGEEKRREEKRRKEEEEMGCAEIYLGSAQTHVA